MKYKIKEFTTSEWGKMAATGILAGALTQFAPSSILGEKLRALIDIIALLGWICLFVWIYRKVKKI